MIIRKKYKKCENCFLRITGIKPLEKWSNRYDLHKLCIRYITRCLNCKTYFIRGLPCHVFIASKRGYDTFDKNALQILDYRISRDVSFIFSKELWRDLL